MYDVIVIGTGGVGSATLYELARRGVKVLGVDRFPPGHDRGSSHGQTRMIRRSYFEHPDYVPLLGRAYRLWDELCGITGEDLFHRTGLVYVGRVNDPAIKGVLESSEKHQIRVERLATSESNERFSGFKVPSGATVLYEPDAGYLRVESCVQAFIREANRLGAETRIGVEVVGWSATDRGVVVETNSGRIAANKLVITAGCWAKDLLADLDVPLQIARKHLHWFATNDDRYSESANCPCFFYAALGGYFYGFPSHSDAGLKVAEHSGGAPVENPLTDARVEDPIDIARVQQFLSKHLRNVSSSRVRHEVCFYTMTSDAHFVVDRHPDHHNVVFAAGLSGHGFKFTPAIGRVLTELTLDDQSQSNIEFLSVHRPGLRFAST